MTPSPATVANAPHSAARIEEITATIAQAFATDPTWRPFLYAGTENFDIATRYWSLFVNTSQRYPCTSALVGEGGEVQAAAVWYPPNADELTKEEEASFPEFVGGLLGAQKRDELLAMSDLFGAAHPTEPHYYLSLLATSPAHRGKGAGMGLLAANLAAFDELGVPTYLESSNPGNDRRYRALGYEQHGTISLPTGLDLTTFWRDPNPR